jgi:Xaa-Pro aminopeptidase
MPDYESRRATLAEHMTAAGTDLIFLPVSADLEYLTGLKRRVLTFGNVEYAHSWVTGAFLAPGRDPVFVLPRMVKEFDLPEGITGDVAIVNELDDGAAIFGRVARSYGPVRKVGVGARTWADTILQLQTVLPDAQLDSASRLVNLMRRVKSPEELAAMARACRIVDEVMGEVTPEVTAGVTELELARDINFRMRQLGTRAPSFDTGVWSMGPASQRDATVRISAGPVEPGLGVSFDFGAESDGYCSDFGRTIHVGEASAEFRRVYDTVMEAQAAGIRAAKPGTLASEVHAATRKVIVEAGLGEWFRHRTGHCIGLDVHELPFISEEDDTPLEAGMTFTIEPSVFRPGHYGARVEDIVVCEEGGGRKLNEYSTDMVEQD